MPPTTTRTTLDALDAPDEQRDTRVPVTVLTGFLGSGKTTLLNRILTENHGLRIAVIENEFGEVGIDDALVVDAEEEIFEMNNGCICCTVRGDLIRILGALMRRRESFDRILIETTGLADPAPVAQTFFMDDEIAAQLRLDAIVTVADAAHILEHLDEVKPAGVENEAIEQVAFADRIVLNKTDLVDQDRLATVIWRLRSINALADILPARRADIALAEVLDVHAFDLDRVLQTDPAFLTETEHQHDASVTSVGIDLPGELDQRKLDTWLGTLLRTRGVDIFRSKGIVALAGSDRQYVFQGVHMLLEAENGREWRADETRGNRLVFIGRNLDRAELNDSFAACLAPVRGRAKKAGQRAVAGASA
jgi:G3E family GTPase